MKSLLHDWRFHRLVAALAGVGVGLTAYFGFEAAQWIALTLYWIVLMAVDYAMDWLFPDTKRAEVQWTQFGWEETLLFFGIMIFFFLFVVVVMSFFTFPR